MRYLLAIVLPPVAFFTMGKPLQGVLNLVLMVTIVGWPIAAIWACLVVNGYHGDKNREKVIRAIEKQTATTAAQADKPEGSPR